MFSLPQPTEIIERAARFGAHLSPEEAALCQEQLAAKLNRFDEFLQARLPEERPPLLFPNRERGYRPSPEEDPHNAWMWRCVIGGGEAGLLRGRTVSFKDHIAVARIPQTFGIHALEGFVPDYDATVVHRALAAGATIVGKNTLGAIGGGGARAASESAMADYWRPKNPHDPARVTQGSSSGSAAAVAAGEVDVAFGGDQAGSVRIPAALCGVVGLKPTFGLVSHMGATFGYEQSLDHIGPIARHAEDAARALEAVAGYDGYDPRQDRTIPDRYDATSGLDRGVRGLRIGVLVEGFDEPIDLEVADGVRAALGVLEQLGAEIVEVSTPAHREVALAIAALACEGNLGIFETTLYGMWSRTFYPQSSIAALSKVWSCSPGSRHPAALLDLMLGSFAHASFHGALYAKAQNVRPHFVRAYDTVLASVDVLAMPTCRAIAEFAGTDTVDPLEVRRRAFSADTLSGPEGLAQNTRPFNYTGHPTLAIPCGKSQGMPFSLQLVANKLDDALLLRVAYAFEHAVDWEDQLSLG